MKGPKRANRCAIAHDRFDDAVPPVFLLEKAVSVIHARVPSCETALPVAEVIFDADVLPENFVAPAVMVAGDPENRNAALAQVSEGRERTEAAARYDSLPLEPEIEQVAIDDERPGSSLEPAQKTDEGFLDVERGDAEVRIGYDVTWRAEHLPIVAGRRMLHKPATVSRAAYLIRR